MKLFKVILRGFHKYNTSFVVAECPTSAYNSVLSFLEKNNFCFSDERELLSVELIADSKQYCRCETMLFLPTAQNSDIVEDQQKQPLTQQDSKPQAEICPDCDNGKERAQCGHGFIDINCCRCNGTGKLLPC